MAKTLIGKKKAATQTLECATIVQMDTLSARVKAGGDYGKWGIELFMSKAIPAGTDPSEAFDEMTLTLKTKVDDYIEENNLVTGSDEEVHGEEETTDSEIDVSDKNEEGEGDEEGLTEDDIRSMKKADLIELIEEEDIDVDPSDYKKIADLREAIIEVAFGDGDGEDGDGEDGDGEDGDGEDGDGWGDFDSDAEGGEEGDGEEGLTEDDIMAMKRPELLELIEEEDLGVDPKKYKVLSKLRKAVILDAFGEE